MVALQHNLTILQIKQKILLAALHIIPFDGWRPGILEKASKKAGFDEKIASLVFKNGLRELLDFYLQTVDQQMLEDAQELDLKNLKIHQRIFEALKIRIQLLSKHQMVAIKTITYLSLPWNLSFACMLGWRTVDLIWKEVCNDQSTDYNYYTKRSLLYAVYTSTIVYWLADESEDNNDTFSFLQRRLNNVLQLGKLIKSRA